MTNVQQGMKSRGFKGSRTNPLQETSVSNFTAHCGNSLRKGIEHGCLGCKL